MKRVALIFDDGPVPAQAEALRRVFADAGIPVTFAHVGRTVREHPAVTQAARDAGHEVVNHSDTHARIAELDAAGVEAEVARAQAAIAETLGRAPAWYWPPYLSVDERLLESLARVPLQVYVPHHLVDSKDWDRSTTADDLRHRATTGVRDGSVILFHEWREETLQQLPAILQELKQQGCTFHTLSGLRAELDARPPAEPADAHTQSIFAPRPPA